MSHKETLVNVLLPEVIQMIMVEEEKSDIDALYSFYLSKTYESLTKEKTKLYKLSSIEIYNMYKLEVAT